MRIPYRWFVFPCIALAALQCTPARFPVIKPAAIEQKDLADKAKAEQYFIQARAMEYYGMEAQAERLYERAYALDPSSPELRDQVVRKYIDAGKFTKALVFVKGKKKTCDLMPDEKRTAALIYLKTGELAGAVEIFESIADKNEDDLRSLAVIYESMGNTENALRYYYAYYRSRGASAPLGLGLKIVRMQMAQRQFAAAETLTTVLLERFGEKAELFDLQGVLALARGDTASALQFFNTAAGVDSSFEEGLRNAAQLYLQKNDYRRAIEYYLKLYRKSGMFRDAYGRTLSMLYYYNRQFDEAARLITALLENSINDTELHFYLGLVFIALEKNESGRVEIEKAISLRADYEEAWRELFNLSVRMKDYDGACAIAQRYCRIRPDNGGAFRLEGYALTMKKDYRGALPSFIRSTELDSMDAGAWYDLGSCYERSNDIAHAADAFRRVLRLRPGDPAASNYLGYMWAEKGMKLDSAKTLLESALSKDPDNGAFLDSYGWIFFQSGDVKNAYDYIRKAMARIHNDPVVFEHLGDILVKHNDREGAGKAYGRSLEYNSDNTEPVRKKIIELEALPR